jgi:hypothetical protein
MQVGFFDAGNTERLAIRYGTGRPRRKALSRRGDWQHNLPRRRPVLIDLVRLRELCHPPLSGRRLILQVPPLVEETAQ